MYLFKSLKFLWSWVSVHAKYQSCDMSRHERVAALFFTNYHDYHDYFHCAHFITSFASIPRTLKQCLLQQPPPNEPALSLGRLKAAPMNVSLVSPVSRLALFVGSTENAPKTIPSIPLHQTAVKNPNSHPVTANFLLANLNRVKLRTRQFSVNSMSAMPRIEPYSVPYGRRDYGLTLCELSRSSVKRTGGYAGCGERTIRTGQRRSGSWCGFGMRHVFNCLGLMDRDGSGEDLGGHWIPSTPRNG